MVVQWLRAAMQDPARQAACLTYAVAITVAQVGWVAIAIVNSSLGVTFILVAVRSGSPADRYSPKGWAERPGTHTTSPSAMDC